MKWYLLFIILYAPLTSSTLYHNHRAPAIEWINGTEIDMGKIKSRKIAVAIFNFKNTGDEPLLISETRTPCHCTVASFTLTPVQPGEKGFIRVTFDPEHVTGLFNKSIQVITNITGENIKLTIRGDVVK